jgi:hypothetical protein
MAAEMKKIVPGQLDSIVAYNKIFLKECSIHILYGNLLQK